MILNGKNLNEKYLFFTAAVVIAFSLVLKLSFYSISIRSFNFFHLVTIYFSPLLSISIYFTSLCFVTSRNQLVFFCHAQHLKS